MKRIERVSSWKMHPCPGDSITVVDVRLGSQSCVIKVTVRGGGTDREALRRQGLLLYSTREELDKTLTGPAGVVSIDDRGVTWAWGWTTDEAKAFTVKAALVRG